MVVVVGVRDVREFKGRVSGSWSRCAASSKGLAISLRMFLGLSFSHLLDIGFPFVSARRGLFHHCFAIHLDGE